MYLCNYNQKNVRKNTFLWAIGKIPLFMRFFIMFMFMSIGISYAETVHSQNAAMEFRFQDVTIEKALKEIEKKTGYNFFYNTKDFNVKRKISFSAKGMNLSEVLNGIFANSQVDYVINGTDIVLKRREEVSNVSNEKYQIKGSVRDGNGEPVIGASVVLKGHTETGVITDIDGNFVLTVPAKKVTLSISYIGYDPVNVEATVGTFVKVVMKESSQTLNEVVVVGYGTQKKESVVGSVQMVKPDELKVPSSQLSTGFAGRLAGVVAVQRSGEPGADGADFWIRGISTFNGTRSPLIIIDGVQASSGDLNAIDPEVIESFSVLKDATATALYGSRGANGVMIVKTKSGRESDKAIVNIRLENAYSTHTKTPKFVDGVRYMEMYNEAVLTRGTGEVLYSDNKIAGTRAGLDPLIYPNVNWYDELFRSGAMNQNINVTIRGGSKKLDYFSSVSVNHDSGVLRNTDDFSYKNNLNIMRYVFQNNFNLNLSKSSKLSLNLNVQLRDYSGPTSNTSDLFGMVMESNPVDFPVRFPDDPNVDYIRWGGKSGGKYNSGFRNPYAEMARGYQSQFESTVMANLKFEQKLDFITEGLSAEALFSFKNWSSTNTDRSAGYNQFQVINYNTDNLSDYTLNRIGSEQSTVLQTSNKSSGDRRLYIQAMINYNRTFNTVHNVSGMFLYNQDQYNGNAPEDLIESLPQRKQGFAGRVTYAYDYRYMAELNFGYNGSENFAKGNRFGFFPSGSIGYVISEEAFMKKQKVVDYLKLRASIGLVGNDNISDNRFLYLSNSWLVDQLPSEKDYWNAYKNGYNFGFNNGNMIKGAIESRIGNPNVSWETALKQNYGIDVNFLNNRLKVSADIFFEDRKDILIKRQTIPITTNLTSDNLPVVNMGRVKNHGYEIDLKWEDVIKGKLHYYINANVSYNRNKIIFQDEVEPNEPYQWRTGQPVGTIFGYVADGFYNDSDFENGKLKEGLPKPTMDVSPGDVKYTDLNGDGLITDDDQRAIGNPTRPAYTWGLNYGADYKGFFFSMNWTAATERSLVLDYFFRKPFGNNANNALMQFHADNRWTPATAETATVPRFATKSMDYNSYTSSLWVKNGNFLKLKTLTIGYNFKERKALKKLGISQLGIKFSGYNLLTFDSFKIMDPECTPGLTDSYPIIKIYNIGINLTF